MGQTRFNSKIVPKDSEEAVGRIYIPYSAVRFGPAAVITAAEIGSWSGFNVDTAEAFQTVLEFPEDMDVTAAMTIEPYLVFDGISDDDTIGFALTYTVDAGTLDPVHVAPATDTGVTDAAVLTLVEATHESRLLNDGSLAATIAADTFTTTQRDAPSTFALNWVCTLDTITQAQYIIYGVMIKYTRRFV